jgi:hypothetical protein
MNMKILIIGLIVLLLLYPVISVVILSQEFGRGSTAERLAGLLNSYRISLWLSWVVMAGLAVFYKWTTESNFFFNFIYIFLGIGFGFFGYYSQRMVNIFDLPSSFSDTYTLGFLTGIQNFVVPAVLTGFLQAGVWWFTRRWHRS